MGKTDKELTVDVVNAYVQSWNAKPNTAPVQTDELTDLISSVYKAISGLDDSMK